MMNGWMEYKAKEGDDDVLVMLVRPGGVARE